MLVNKLWKLYLAMKLKKHTHSSTLGFQQHCVSNEISKTLKSYLYVKWSFQENLLNVFQKVKIIGLLCKLQNLLSRTTLVTIYLTFVRPSLDYGDILYYQAFNNSFYNRFSIKYYACFAITGTIRGTSRENFN